MTLFFPGLVKSHPQVCEATHVAQCFYLYSVRVFAVARFFAVARVFCLFFGVVRILLEFQRKLSLGAEKATRRFRSEKLSLRSEK